MIANFLCIYLVTIIRFVIFLHIHRQIKMNIHRLLIRAFNNSSHSKNALQVIQNIGKIKMKVLSVNIYRFVQFEKNCDTYIGYVQFIFRSMTLKKFATKKLRTTRILQTRSSIFQKVLHCQQLVYLGCLEISYPSSYSNEAEEIKDSTHYS